MYKLIILEPKTQLISDKKPKLFWIQPVLRHLTKSDPNFYNNGVRLKLMNLKSEPKFEWDPDFPALENLLVHFIWSRIIKNKKAILVQSIMTSLLHIIKRIQPSLVAHIIKRIGPNKKYGPFVL